ncbi:AbrB/MazE/SpoVT family DNA-binding domain-containing protein [Bacillus anthracis]|uniref:AbrB/MazE/SpoVT family DNA-binding domain-containing protein n=1 Tax=Bacillus anthracis TaxID=1392 RepID=UPI00099B4F19|nr:AbrB/MazE/SpoVT family DNA-binding domain-containing protein [Bacillus anthracis]OPD54058.1 hypothetical protein BVG01_29345 [Bacillus anthracis]
MKPTGIMRKFDTVGRISVPVEIRKRLGIKEKDAMEIFLEGDKIILQKYQHWDSRQKMDKRSSEKSFSASANYIPDSKKITELLTELQRSFVKSIR